MIGRSKGGDPVTTDDLGVSGALCVLMKVCILLYAMCAEIYIFFLSIVAGDVSVFLQQLPKPFYLVGANSVV